MPILTEPTKIRPILKKLAAAKIAVPCFCSENVITTEGILTGAANVAKRLGLDLVPVYVAATANYPGRQQLKNYTMLNSTEEGFMAFRADLERLARAGGPFPNVLVLPSLDHGQPGMDDFLFEMGVGFWACVMYDCSTLPLAENRKKTADFVQRHKKDYLIEGCVDEIISSGKGGKMKLTDPDDAKQFLSETEVDLMVVNLGTEHRATKADLRYHSDIAKKISSLVGQRLVLHGTSSLTKGDLVNLRLDGMAKVNIWTILETDVTQKVLAEHIRQVGKILSKEQVCLLADEGWLGPKALEHSAANNPTLGFMTEVYRRNELKIPAISKLVEDYFIAFGYEGLKSAGKPL